MTATSPQRLAVSVVAPARTIEGLFGVTLRDYRDPAGRTFQAPVGEPRVPRALTGLVAAVDGLDSRPSERPAFRGPIAAGPEDGMTPRIIDRVYELEGLRALGLNGEGQTVAIVSLDTFDPGDIKAFDRLAGTSGPAVKRVAVNGGVDSPGDGQDEVSLDIEVIRAVAPKAQILDYEAPNEAGSIAAVIDRIVKDGRADIVSISWGSCEAGRSSSALARMASSMAAAAAAGISVFVASGDHGAYDCIDSDRSDLRVSVDLPAGDVNAISVGGTLLSMLDDGTWVDEVAWEEPLTGWGPGGGVSDVYPRPAWQTGIGVDNSRSNGKRQVPDVAAAADPISGFLTVSAGEKGAARRHERGVAVLGRPGGPRPPARPARRRRGPRPARPDALSGRREPAGRRGLPRRDPRRQPARRRRSGLGLRDRARKSARHSAGAGHRGPAQGRLLTDRRGGTG